MEQPLTTWQNITAAPHRSMFLFGAIQGILTLLWWLYELAGRTSLIDNTLTWSIAPTWAHAFLMIYGFFPFFIFGFLFTTYPNWTDGEKIKRQHYATTAVLLAAGSTTFYLGLISNEHILALGVAIMLAGWSIALYAMTRVLNTSTPGKEKRHTVAAHIAVLSGWLGIAAYLLWLLTQNSFMLDFARSAGIWFFLTPIVIIVSHRMIPFFSSRVLDNYVMVRPYWLLWLMLACSAGHGLLQIMGMLPYYWLVDLPLAISALYLSFKWGFLRSFSVSLLAVLHISFLWLGISMLLFGLQSLIFMLSAGELFIGGLAPLHALTIGYFASMVLGMASRVTLGHSGRPLVLDSFTWLLFLGFQTTTLIRVLADVIPSIAQHIPMLYVAAGFVWLLCFTLWGARFIPIYWRARIDGKPG